MDDLNYHHLLNFWLVSREGSIRGASEALHVTPGSVSVQVRRLEEALGAELLRKEGRGVALTDTGQQVAEYAEQIFATGRELVETVRGGSTGRTSELRVGILEVMPKLVAFELLQPALSAGDPVRLICEEGTLGSLVADLAIHKLDVVLTDTALDPGYKVQAYSHRLGKSSVAVVGSPELAKRFAPGFPGSLQGAPFLLPTDASVLRRQLNRWFSDRDLQPEVRGEFADSAMIKIAARSGLGLFAVPTMIEETVRNIYGFEHVGVADGVAERFYAVSVERRVRHPGVMAIREHALLLNAD